MDRPSLVFNARLAARAAVIEGEIEALAAHCLPEVEAAPERLLGAVTTALGAKGAAILELDSTTGAFRALHGAPRPPPPWPVRALPGLAARLAWDTPAWIAEDAPGMAADAAWLGQRGWRGVLVVPLGGAAEAPRCLAVHGLADEPRAATRFALALVAGLCSTNLRRAALSAALARAEERFELSQQGSPAALFEWDVGEGRVYWSPQIRALLGYGSDTPADRVLWRDIVHADDVARVERAVAEHLDGKTPCFDLVYRCLRRDGAAFWAWGRFSAKRDADGALKRVVGTLLDITDRVDVEEALQREQARAATTLAAIDDGVVTLDETGRIEYLNPAAERLIGGRCGELRGQAMDELPLPRPVIAALLDATRRCAESGLPMRLQDAVELEVAPQRASFVEASFAPLASHGGRAGCVLVLRDVTSQRALALELAYQASHDELTGLINRREFEARLAGAAAGETPHALMYLDLDRFKVVNDTCGHAAGDALLRELGGSLRAAAPQEATVARLGGDEFGVLLPCADDRVAARAAEALRVAVERLRFRWGERSFRIGVSIGLVPVARDATVAELLAAADTACYAAKDAGRNRVHAGDSNDAELRRRRDELGWVARLHAALDAGRFALWRQPIRALDGGGEHHEMLLRMHDEQGRLVLPGEFIPAAERHGLMPELDRWVVEHACAWLARTPEAGMHALNLSGQTLSDLGFHAFVSDALARHDVAPARLCFEITETAAIRQPECALESIQALRAAGCRFALDDFGSGLASFAYLKRLPVDLLKIDGAFVRRIHEDPVDRELVRAANGLAHLMGMRTVAEYAESEAVLAVLRELGVDYAQGYAIGRPEPLPEA